MRNEERTSIREEGDKAVDVSVSRSSDDVVKDDIDKFAAFLYHLYREKQG